MREATLFESSKSVNSAPLEAKNEARARAGKLGGTQSGISRRRLASVKRQERELDQLKRKTLSQLLNSDHSRNRLERSLDLFEEVLNDLKFTASPVQLKFLGSTLPLVLFSVRRSLALAGLLPRTGELQ
jgi:hypothetical protein